MKRLLVFTILLTQTALADEALDQAMLMYLLANRPNQNAWVQPLQNLADSTKEGAPERETVCETQTRTLLSGKTITRTICK